MYRLFLSITLAILTLTACSGDLRLRSEGGPPLDCADIECPHPSECEMFGNFAVCSCPDGYESNGTDGTDCVDINECGISDICGPYSDCMNETGGYRCECRTGFMWNGSYCVPPEIGTFELTTGEDRPGGRFGETLAINEDTLLVGQRGNVHIAPIVHVYKLLGTHWIHTDIWTFEHLSDGVPSVAISGDHAAVGFTPDEGQHQIVMFERTDSHWVRTDTLVIPQGEMRLRTSLSMDGDTLLVHTGTGAYFYKRDHNGWDIDAHIDIPTQHPATTGLSGDHAMIRVLGTTDPDAQGLIIFQRIDQIWNMTKTILADPNSGTQFEGTISIHGNHAIVGDVIFEFRDDEWQQIQAITALSGHPSVSSIQNDRAIICSEVTRDLAIVERAENGHWSVGEIISAQTDSLGFCDSAVLSEDYIAVSAPESNDGGVKAGKVEIHRVEPCRADSPPFQEFRSTAKELRASDRNSQRFWGGTLALEGDIALVSSVTSVGVGAIVFQRQEEWTWVNTLSIETEGELGPCSRTADLTGALDISEGQVIIGIATWAQYSLGQIDQIPGKVYIFDDATLANNSPVELIAEHQEDFNLFGDHVAISGDIALVGGTKSIDVDSGFINERVYFVFEKQGSDWINTAELTAGEISYLYAPQYSERSHFLGISEDAIYVGSPNATGPDTCGVVEIFTRTSSGWAHTETITPPEPGCRHFGHSVAVNDSWLAVGTREDSRAYIYQHIDEGWELMTTLTPDVNSNSSENSSILDVQENSLLVGIPQADRVFHYAYNGQDWDIFYEFALPEGPDGAHFGATLDFDGDTFLIGAPSYSNYWIESGTAWIFEYPAVE